MALDDSYSKVLLHFDGDNNSTTFTDESGKTWTASGNAKISTAQSVFGGASGLFTNGSSDYISTPDHNDFTVGSANATWDFRAWPSELPTSGNWKTIYNQWQDINNRISISIVNVSGTLYLEFFVTVAGSTIIYASQAISINVNEWHHFAIVKNGTSYLHFLDGTQQGTSVTQTTAMPNIAGSLYLARFDGSSLGYKGYLDEFRFSNGIARWTSNFTPQATPYAPPVNNSLNAANTSYSLSGIDLSFNKTLSIPAGAETYALSGQALSLGKEFFFSAAAENYSLSGPDSSFLKALSANLVAGGYSVSGADADLHHPTGYLINLASGIYAISGVSLSSLITRLLTASPGVYHFEGLYADLTKAEIIIPGDGTIFDWITAFKGLGAWDFVPQPDKPHYNEADLISGMANPVWVFTPHENKVHYNESESISDNTNPVWKTPDQSRHRLITLEHWPWCGYWEKK
jgi:hypothetical protein